MRRLALVVALVVLPVVGAALIATNDDSGRGDDRADRPSLPATPVSGRTGLQVGGARVAADIAATEQARDRGLSGRRSLGEDEGMLFVLKSRATPSFWMKGMRFPLDIVWIDGSTVTDVTERVPIPRRGTSEEKLPLYFPPGPVTQVLEVNAGWADRNEVRRGDIVSIG